MTREMNKPDWDSQWTCERLWRQTGAKFEGTDEELQKLISNCQYQHAWSDEEGFFKKFLCMKNFEICDKQCHKHHPKINEDIREFFENCCERYRK